MNNIIRSLIPTVIRRSYATKFAIALLVIGLAVGLVGFVGTSLITDSVQDNALEDQEALTAQEAATIDNWHNRNLRTVESNSNTPIIEGGTDEEIQNRLVNLDLELGDDVQSLHVADIGSGELTATTTDGQSLSDVDFPDQLSSDLSSSSATYTDAYVADGTPVVSYYIRIGHEDSDRYSQDAALVITYDLQQLSGRFGNTFSGETTVLALNQDREIVLDDTFTGSGSDVLIDGYLDDVFLQPYESDQEWIAQALSGQSESDAMVVDQRSSASIRDDPHNFDHEEFVGSYHTTEMGWTVLVHTSTDEAFGFVNSVNQYGIYATVAGILFIVLIGAAIGRNTASSIDRLTGKVAEMEDGNLDVEFQTGRIDNIGRLYDGFAEMRDELKQQITEAEEARAEAERERERVQQLNDDLQSAASAYCGVMGDAADGDLTVRMDPNATDNDTMREIGEDFNDMLTEIEATVESLNQFATEVATASEQVTASSEEVRSASEQVSESVQEISDGANQQYESLRSVDNEMSNLSTTTEEIAASSNEVADVAERTARTGREGKEAASEAIDAVETLEDERESVVEEFAQLRDDVAQIDQLVERVGEIAEQTNMLALNANIEASRSAGSDDDGGFAAVAAEVKELSQDVKEATEEIDDQLEGIQTQTERSAEEVERTSEEIERVGELVTDTVDALEEIAEYAQETNDGVQEISAATEEQAASTEEVVAMIDDVASIAEQTTTQAEGVAAAAEEQTTAMTEVSNSANDLTEQALALSEALDRFDTDAPADDSVVGLEYDETDDGGAGESFAFGEPGDEDTASPDDADDGRPGDDRDGSTSATDDAPSDDGDATWDAADDDSETFSLDG
ncbi:methyl-accepting chemotaxis protein [Halovivax cerinus]|uniref:Methyl-accepting chemotaxis protein n=1 Tax=Halovivax cerinus TaxID=1487865 RepID=A0ABD5NPX3_9EURY|nr:methyl-accepting chemotaxis protein [Halovivax cerinus]